MLDYEVISPLRHLILSEEYKILLELLLSSLLFPTATHLSVPLKEFIPLSPLYGEVGVPKGWELSSVWALNQVSASVEYKIVPTSVPLVSPTATQLVPLLYTAMPPPLPKG